MLGKDFLKSLPPNGRMQALLAVKRSFEALSAPDNVARRCILPSIPAAGTENKQRR
jgi:hypothetical protein